MSNVCKICRDIPSFNRDIGHLCLLCFLGQRGFVLCLSAQAELHFPEFPSLFLGQGWAQEKLASDLEGEREAVTSSGPGRGWHTCSAAAHCRVSAGSPYGWGSSQACRCSLLLLLALVLRALQIPVQVPMQRWQVHRCVTGDVEGGCLVVVEDQCRFKSMLLRSGWSSSLVLVSPTLCPLSIPDCRSYRLHMGCLTSSPNRMRSNSYIPHSTSLMLAQILWSIPN